jgi:RNA 2',3'-cyclic 3'-phosphodiesterase
MTHKRLFVGARVSVATANALAGAAETLARRARDAGIDIRWVAPVNYHVTLKFLGNTRVEAITAVRDALEAAATSGDAPRIAFRTARLGAFPALDRARIVWAGVEEQGSLAALAARIDAACIRLGYAAEPRPFHAHVTLGRLREIRPLKEVVLPLSEQMFGDTRIDAITLFESETKSSGSVYREMFRIGFKNAENPASDVSKRQTSGLEVETRDDTDDGWPRGHVPNT